MGWVGQGAKDGLSSWTGGPGGGGSTAYHYGWPSGGTLEPNVAAQWLFDEASGDIVDEVASITLADQGSPTYNVAATGLWAGLSPGIKTTSSGYFLLAGTNAAMDPDLTNGNVVEFVCSMDAGTTGVRYVLTHNNIALNVFFTFYFNSPTQISFLIEANDGTFKLLHLTLPINAADGVIRKYRWVLNYSGNAEAFQDGVSCGTSSIATLAGKAFTFERLVSHATIAGSARWQGTLYEFRKSNNLTNNSGGPGGG